MKKKRLFVCLLVFFSVTHVGYTQQPDLQGAYKELLAGPTNPTNHDAWLTAMKKWRAAEKNELKYDGAEYLRPEFGWIKKTFIYVQMMAHERYFYDPVARKYTVERYLADLKKRYGGIDAVLIWPTYPNMGIDSRNQYDLLADMPDGIAGIKQMIVDFKKHGVRVFFPIMAWDHGTRRIGWTMPVALMNEMKIIGADGMIGDTMDGIPEDFRNVYDSLGYPVCLQPEGSLSDLNMLKWNTMSWGYYWDYEYIPGVSLYKWLEPRHQVIVTNRWAVDKTDDLQYAFFNGIGYNAWENIWGIWNQVPDRYAEIIRRIASIYREFPNVWSSVEWEPHIPVLQSRIASIYREFPNVWSSVEWEPHIPVLQKGIFASRFPGTDKTVYTLVNRDSMDINGDQLQLPYQGGMNYFDLWNGTALVPHQKDDSIILSFTVEGRGFSSVLAIKNYEIDSSVQHFITDMHTREIQPLKSLSVSWRPLQQQITVINKTKPAGRTPVGMVMIPAIKDYLFSSNGVMIEGDDLPQAVGVQHPGEPHPARSQKQVMNIPSFYIDKYPVTNKQFKKFIDETHYHPKDDHNFLKHWQNGIYPKGWDNKPVTWVSLEDARAYSAWAGKRLPHEWEWQYAAQGNDGRQYPWGNTMDNNRMPLPDSSRDMRAPANVNAFPKGASPFGVMDMVGNVWQWTDEYSDEHTRAAVLKGGGYYRATTSHWYFPRAYELDKYGKYLLMAPCIDRSASIGFRCVMDR